MLWVKVIKIKLRFLIIEFFLGFFYDIYVLRMMKMNVLCGYCKLVCLEDGGRKGEMGVCFVEVGK